MALFKKNQDGSAAPAAPPALRKSLITRGHLPEEWGDPVAEDARHHLENRDGDAGFEDGLPHAGQPAAGKVFGNQTRTTNPMLRTLPPMASAVRVPGSAAEAHALAQGQTLAQPPPPDPGGPPQMAHSQPMIQQGPPVDQAIIEEAQRKAQQIMGEAQQQAQQMMQAYEQQIQQQMQQANQQIQEAGEQVQRQAQEIGFKQGYEAGLAQGAVAGQEGLTQLILSARDVYVQAIRQRHILLKGAEPQLARLACKIAEKIIGIQIDSNSEAVVGVVRSCVEILGDREEVSIRVNPKDLENVRAHRTVFEKLIEGLRRFEIVPDAAIDTGGCTIETNLGNIDARLSTQIATITAALENLAKAQDREVIEEAENMAVDFPDTGPPPEGG